jgi:hypothetical protein
MIDALISGKLIKTPDLRTGKTVIDDVLGGRPNDPQKHALAGLAG